MAGGGLRSAGRCKERKNASGGERVSAGWCWGAQAGAGLVTLLQFAQMHTANSKARLKQYLEAHMLEVYLFA